MPRSGRRPRVAATLAATAAVLAACGADGATPLVHRGNAVPVHTTSLTAVDVAAAQTAFGIDLLQTLCERSPGEDVLVSPTSAAQALSLLHPAATGQTAEALRGLLHLPEWSPAVVAALRDHTATLDRLRSDGDLDDEDAPDSLQTSNRLWTALGLQPDPRYLDHIATALGADVRTLDFAADPGGATRRINTTVAEDTRGVIEQLFDDPLPTSTVAVLTNAVHLRARWADAFDATAPAPFATPAGDVTVDMMGGGTGELRTADGWRAVELPYRDGTLTAVAVLPPEGTDPCAVDAETLVAVQTGESEPVGVRLPRTAISRTHSLLGPLVDLGLPPMGDYPALGGDLEISHAVQRTFLQVDEDGTEAAAATGLAVAVAAGPAATLPLVTFDRPFLLLLTDTQTRSPLFISAINTPST
ncbi:serpin family protein [Geodermatophilus sp. URMC 61]|uniref:serpin family protein n=1 Tax=Geodermatophilus sp. URMC 61 TaxID=3423411 RepID=UPI00406D2BAD